MAAWWHAAASKMTIKNETVKQRKFLASMIEDDYYPKHLVEKGQRLLAALAERIEKEAPKGSAVYALTHATTEAFNILLPLLGAIVTDSGGLLSHAAIVAREYGLPGVVGTREATRRIADGVRVRVDGNAGEVTVLG